MLHADDEVEQEMMLPLIRLKVSLIMRGIISRSRR